MNGINPNIFTKSLSGLSDIYADDIVTTNITATNIYTSTGTNILSTANDLQNQINDIVTYDTENTTTTNSLQTQINSILAYDMSSTTTINNLQNQVNGITSTSTTGGGYFTVVCERLGHVANNTFGFGAGLYNNNEIVLPACTLKMSRITASQNVTSGTTYYVFYKNGVGTSISTGIYSGSSSNQVTHNLTFASGDTFKIVTLNSGSYTTNTTVQLRINLIFECVGIKGADGISPTLTIGTVSTLPSSSDATVTNTGTSTNQIINYGIPRGLQGLQGDPGNDAITPTFIIGSVTNLSSGNTPFVSYDNASTTTNKIFNFGLVQGLKGDKGDPAPTVNAGDIGNAIGTTTVFIALQAQVFTLQGQMSTLNLITIPAIDAHLETLDTTTGQTITRVGTLEDEMDTNVLPKLLYITKTTDALQVKTKFQITNNVLGLGNIVLSTFDPTTNIITLGNTATTNNMSGNAINMGSLTTANINLRGTSISIGNETGSIQTTTTNIRGTTINTGSTDTTTTNIKGTTINVGENNFSDTINVEAPHINIGSGTNTSINIGTTLASIDITNSTATVDINGTTIDIAQNSDATVNIGTFDTDVNIEGQTVNIGYHAFGSTNVINMQASTINIGTVGVASSVNIGNVLSNVNIQSLPGTSIGISNFINQF